MKFVISDSGGIQEECATFKKKILVCRDNNLPLRVFNLIEKDALINTMTNERVGTLVGH